MPNDAAPTLAQAQPGMPNDPLTPQRVGDYYDAWTARYRTCFGNTLQACRPTELDALHQHILMQAGIRDGERVLDAGCGVCGPSLYFARQRDVSIDAVTVSAGQVAIARELVAEAGLAGRIQVHLGDFTRLDTLFDDATFDRVLFLESLSHAADPAAPLQAVFKVLKPGGVVYIKDFFKRDGETPEQQRLIAETIARVDRTFVLKTPSLQHTVDVLARTGFEHQHVAPISFTADNSAWSAFNAAHEFDLYGGEAPLQWCDWMELRFRKPAV